LRSGKIVELLENLLNVSREIHRFRKNDVVESLLRQITLVEHFCGANIKPSMRNEFLLARDLLVR
jgi:hypothetical protein